MLPGGAVGVVLVPIDTGRVGGVVVGIIIQGALETLFPPRWDTSAVAHPVLPGLGADEGVLIFVLCLVVSLQIHRVGAERVQTGGLHTDCGQPGKVTTVTVKSGLCYSGSQSFFFVFKRDPLGLSAAPAGEMMSLTGFWETEAEHSTTQ